MTRTTLAVLLVAATLVMVAGCSDDGTRPSERRPAGSGLIGDWAVVDENATVPVDGFRITPDFRIEILGVEWSTGELVSTGWNADVRIVDRKPWGELTLEKIPGGFSPPGVVRETYHYTATENTLRLSGETISWLVRSGVTYRRIEPGTQVVDPVESTLRVNVSEPDRDYVFESDAVSRSMSARAVYTPADLLLPDILRIRGWSHEYGSVAIVLSGSVQPGTYAFDNVTSYADLTPPVAGDVVYSYYTLDGSVTIDTVDLDNGRVSGTFHAVLEESHVLTDGRFDVRILTP